MLLLASIIFPCCLLSVFFRSRNDENQNLEGTSTPGPGLGPGSAHPPINSFSKQQQLSKKQCLFTATDSNEAAIRAGHNVPTKQDPYKDVYSKQESHAHAELTLPPATKQLATGAKQQPKKKKKQQQKEKEEEEKKQAEAKKKQLVDQKQLVGRNSHWLSNQGSNDSLLALRVLEQTPSTDKSAAAAASSLVTDLRLPVDVFGSTAFMQSTTTLADVRWQKQACLDNLLGSIGSYLYLADLQRHLPPEVLAYKSGWLFLFKQKRFLIMLVSVLFSSMTVIAPVVIFYDRLKLAKIPDDSIKLVLMACGLSSAVSRVFTGCVANLDCLNQRHYSIGCCIMLTVSHLLSSWITLTWQYMIYGIVFGFYTGAKIVIQPLLIAQMVPIHALTNAMGVCLFVEGLGYSLGPPIVGLVYEKTKQYSHCCLVFSMFIGIAGLLELLINLSYFVRLVGCTKGQTRGCWQLKGPLDSASLDNCYIGQPGCQDSKLVWNEQLLRDLLTKSMEVCRLEDLEKDNLSPT